MQGKQRFRQQYFYLNMLPVITEIIFFNALCYFFEINNCLINVIFTCPTCDL